MKIICQGKYIFAQLADFLPQRVFDRLVSKYDGNKHVKHFSCWNQLLSMIFGQLTGRDSLRDMMVSIEPSKPKYYHLGFGKGTSRSNFANSNEKRYCRIFKEYAFFLIDVARKSSIVDQDFKLNNQCIRIRSGAWEIKDLQRKSLLHYWIRSRFFHS